MGGDPAEEGERLAERVSIHTSTWEVTVKTSDTFGAVTVSIHTSTWEVTLAGCEGEDKLEVSIHTSTWEVTSYDNL